MGWSAPSHTRQRLCNSVTVTNAYCYTYAYTDCYSYANGHCNQYAAADAHATVRADAKTSSHTWTETVMLE